MQAGVVLAACGIGMNYVSRRVDPVLAGSRLHVQRHPAVARHWVLRIGCVYRLSCPAGWA